MPMLVGLPGAPKKNTDVEFFKTPREVMPILDREHAASCAEENGCISVWKDRQGAMRADLQRFYRTVETETFYTFNALRKWLSPRLREIRQKNPETVRRREALADDMTQIFGKKQ